MRVTGALLALRTEEPRGPQRESSASSLATALSRRPAGQRAGRRFPHGARSASSRRSRAPTDAPAALLHLTVCFWRSGFQ